MKAARSGIGGIVMESACEPWWGRPPPFSSAILSISGATNPFLLRGPITVAGLYNVMKSATARALKALLSGSTLEQPAGQRVVRAPVRSVPPGPAGKYGLAISRVGSKFPAPGSGAGGGTVGHRLPGDRESLRLRRPPPYTGGGPPRPTRPGLPRGPCRGAGDLRGPSPLPGGGGPPPGLQGIGVPSGLRGLTARDPPNGVEKPPVGGTRVVNPPCYTQGGLWKGGADE